MCYSTFPETTFPNHRRVLSRPPSLFQRLEKVDRKLNKAQRGGWFADSRQSCFGLGVQRLFAQALMNQPVIGRFPGLWPINRQHEDALLGGNLTNIVDLRCDCRRIAESMLVATQKSYIDLAGTRG